MLYTDNVQGYFRIPYLFKTYIQMIYLNW